MLRGRRSEAEGSGLGFGAMGKGAISSETLCGAAAGAAGAPPQPPVQLGPASQQADWHFGLAHLGLAQKRLSKKSRTGVFLQRHACPQAAFSQQATGFSQQAGFSQQTLHLGLRQGLLWQHGAPQAAFSQQATGFSQQAGLGQAFSQTAGAGQQTAGFGQAFSQTAGAGQQTAGFGQAFSQTAGAGQQTAGFGQAFSQQAGWPQAGSQAVGFGQQHFTLPHLRQANMSFSPLNRSHRFLQQGLQAGWQQAGSGAQGLTAGSQAAAAAHGPQPPPLRTTMRSIRSMLNPWLARAALTKSAPRSNFPFIEQTLLYKELG